MYDDLMFSYRKLISLIEEEKHVLPQCLQGELREKYSDLIEKEVAAVNSSLQKLVRVRE